MARLVPTRDADEDWKAWLGSPLEHGLRSVEGPLRVEREEVELLHLFFLIARVFFGTHVFDY